jgi:uncharacterized PurR-regulated membrane protein YhhQ (DUF165 family)
LASTLAFAVSELADLLVYRRLTRRHGWLIAAAVSNAVGAPIDTMLFLAVAGLPIAVAMPGQLWVKTLATILPLTLVTLTRALLRHRLRRPRS